jgi:hypothetical protein
MVRPLGQVRNVPLGAAGDVVDGTVVEGMVDGLMLGAEP